MRIFHKELHHLKLACSSLCIFLKLGSHLVSFILHALIQDHVAVIAELTVRQHPGLDCLIYFTVCYNIEICKFLELIFTENITHCSLLCNICHIDFTIRLPAKESLYSCLCLALNICLLKKLCHFGIHFL